MDADLRRILEDYDIAYSRQVATADVKLLLARLATSEARVAELAKSRTCRECGAACGHAETCSTVSAQVKTAWRVERLRAVVREAHARDPGLSLAGLEPGDLEVSDER